MAFRIKTIVERMKKKTDEQLFYYVHSHWFKKKEDLIDALEEDVSIKVDRSLTYREIISKYREDVILTIEDLLFNCD